MNVILWELTANVQPWRRRREGPFVIVLLLLVSISSRSLLYLCQRPTPLPRRLPSTPAPQPASPLPHPQLRFTALSPSSILSEQTGFLPYPLLKTNFMIHFNSYKAAVFSWVPTGYHVLHILHILACSSLTNSLFADRVIEMIMRGRGTCSRPHSY